MPSVPNGGGKRAMKRTLPERTVTLDAGVFDWLYGIVESKHRSAQQRRADYESFSPEYLELLDRALSTFQIAAGEEGPASNVSSPAAPVQRVIRRKRRTA